MQGSLLKLETKLMTNIDTDMKTTELQLALFSC